MKYLSLFSGIEAATVAWHKLGWEPVGFSEIEPFPCAVLQHHYPGVINYGDITNYAEWKLPKDIDLIVGGSPCQSFSVAGLRKGLADPRGNLMLTYLAVVERVRPRWVVWENVPGVLSSDGGRALGTFLGALGELGYGWAYRVLDAQWVRTHGHPRAVPQRRRRVFVVGCLGDWSRAAKVLFERESVQRDSSTRRAKGQGAAADAEAGAGCGGWMPNNPGVVSSVCTKWAKGTGGPSGSEHFNLLAQPVPFTKAKRAQSTTDDETWVDGKVNPTLSLFDQGDTRATTAIVGTDLYNGAITGNLAATMGTLGSSVSASGPTVMTVAIAFKPGQSAQARTIGAQVGVACTLEAGGGGNNKQAVAHAFAVRTAQTGANGHGIAEGVSHTLDQAHGQAVAHAAVAYVFRDPSPTLTAKMQGSSGWAPANEDAHLVGQSINGEKTMTVRRLTPRECERLQGFPDDWTLIPWRGKPADQCPDGPRYKALGNSMAVNCMAWIGERIGERHA